MAEQKTYKIHIDGIEQSVKGVESLGDAVKGTTKTFDDYAKVVNKLQQYKDAYAKLEEAQFKKEIKNQYELKQARETVAAGMGKTYAEQQKYLTALGKVIKNTEGDVSDLIKEYKALNDKLKQVDATMGNHQRNVGNYTSALTGLNKPLSGVINIAKSATSAFQLYNGVITAFGNDNKEAAESMEKLMSTMSIIQSLNQLNITLKEGSTMSNLLTKSMNALALGIKGTTTVTKALRIAFMSIGIGLVIGLVTELVLHWEDLVGWFQKTFPVLNNLTQKISAFGSALKKFMIDLPSQAADVLKKLFTGDFKGAMEAAKGVLNDFKNNFWSSYQEEMTVKAAKEGIKRTQQEIAELEIQERNNKTHSKKLIELKKKEFEQRRALAKGNEEELNKIKLDEMKFFADVEDKKTKVAQENAKEREKLAKEEAKRQKEILDAWLKAESDGLKAAQEYKKQIDEEELKNKEKLAKAVRKSDEADYKIEKAALELSIEEAEKDEDKIKLKNKLIDLEAEHEKYLLKLAAMDELGVSEEEFDQMLSGVKVLTDYQAQVISNMQKGVEVINLGVEKQKKSTKPKEKNKEKEHTLTDSWHEFIYGGDGTPDELSSKAKELADAVGTAYQETIGPVFDGVMNLGDAIHQAMEFAIEEAENALEETEEMHDAAVERVEESKDRISEINDKMKDSSGAQLEAYKTQMAEEMLLLQQREQEERRLQKEKEKREKELEKQKKKQRKLELQQQLIQAIVSGALAVVNGLATQPFMPVGIAMGALAGVATAIQIATITKQISKLASGGVLGGREHKDGGNPIPSMGVEVEKGEAVINKRSTAKYLPLLDAINAEGNGGKHTLLQSSGNVIRRYADGGVLNYQRIDDNFNQLNGAAAIARSIESIDFHPVVSVQEISRVQRNIVEVRELSGARN